MRPFHTIPDVAARWETLSNKFASIFVRLSDLPFDGHGSKKQQAYIGVGWCRCRWIFPGLSKSTCPALKFYA